MKRTVLCALAMALAGWAATPTDAYAQGVVVRRTVSRPVVRRTVVVRPPVVRRNVIVTNPVVAPGIVIGAPVVGRGVVVGDRCRTVRRQVRSAGRVVNTTNRVCN